jgi:hypothetical protein
VGSEVRITIDGFEYHLVFGGFCGVTRAASPSGAEIDLQPWPFGEHLAALDACMKPTENGLELDEVEFSGRVLAHSGVPGSLFEEFRPLALWWASGGGEVNTPSIGDGEYRFGAVRARIRPWSGGERFEALSRCRSEDAEGALSFNLGAYLRAMLTASVVLSDASPSLDGMDSASGLALLNAVLKLDVVDPEALADSPLYSPESARQTLRFCRELGWTPTKVWATAATELDHLSALLDRAQPLTPRPLSRGPRLADHPDAVVIHIEDD